MGRFSEYVIFDKVGESHSSSENGKSTFEESSDGPTVRFFESGSVFCVYCASLSLEMPWSRFYNLSLYFDHSSANLDRKRIVRLPHQSVKGLLFWKTHSTDHTSRPIFLRKPITTLHTDAADMHYGATLNFDYLRAGIPGMWCDQDVWYWISRAISIRHQY